MDRLDVVSPNEDFMKWLVMKINSLPKYCTGGWLRQILIELMDAPSFNLHKGSRSIQQVEAALDNACIECRRQQRGERGFLMRQLGFQTLVDFVAAWPDDFILFATRPNGRLRMHLRKHRDHKAADTRSRQEHNNQTAGLFDVLCKFLCTRPRQMCRVAEFLQVHPTLHFHATGSFPTKPLKGGDLIRFVCSYPYEFDYSNPNPQRKEGRITLLR
eukprot:GGOE01055268.1.p1 GENE.GGOE01055268.1~~GGOE01055268.1.p1  ORF type:complete len:215 (-),score=35.26 GGOE01055268.1:177-821(-)